MQTQAQTMKEKAQTMAERVLNNTSDTAHYYVDEAQGVATKIGTQLTDWTDSNAHKAAALWNASGKQIRNAVLRKPFWSLALLVGVSAVTIYMLTRRNSTEQTGASRSVHDDRLKRASSPRNRKATDAS